MRLSLSILLLCSSALAQPMQHWAAANRTSLVSARMTPTNIFNGVAYWWVASDNPSNVIVSNWVDRIQAVVKTNGDTTVRPTNNSLVGVYFNSSVGQFVTNATLNNSTALNTYWLVMQRDGNHAGNLVGQSISANFPGFLISGSGSPQMFSAGQLFTGPVLPNATMIDVLFVCERNGVNQTNAFYTNGVPWTTTNTLVDIGSFTMRTMGKDLGNGAYSGYITEFGVVTNIWPTPVQASNLHYYFTNTYTNIIK